MENAEYWNQSVPDQQNREPTSRGRLHLEENGSYSGTAAAWSDDIGYANSSPVKRHLRAHTEIPYGTIKYRGREIRTWHEESVKELIASRSLELSTAPQGFGKIEAVVLEDGSQQQIGSVKQWLKTSGITEGSIRAANVSPEVSQYRGKQIRTLSEAQIAAILANSKERQRGGVYFNPDDGGAWASMRRWEEISQFSKGYLVRRIRDIKAVGEPLPENAWGPPDQQIYSFHTICAAREHSHNRLLPSTQVTPDPKKKLVIGSVEAWADFLNISCDLLAKRLRQKFSPVLSLGGRNRAKIYSYEQVLASSPEHWNPPQYLARVPSKLFLPGDKNRYITVNSTELVRLERNQVPMVKAINTKGVSARYFLETEVVGLRAVTFEVSDVSTKEYLESVAAYHPLPQRLKELAQMQKLASIENTDRIVLDSSGVVEIQGCRVAPLSVTLEYVLKNKDQAEASRLASAFGQLELEPSAFGDVTWPGHWEGKARLWLYDFKRVLSEVELFADCRLIDEAFHSVKQLVENSQNQPKEHSLAGEKLAETAVTDSRQEDQRKTLRQEQKYVEKQLKIERSKIQYADNNLKILQPTNESVASRRRVKYQERLNQLLTGQVGKKEEKIFYPIDWVDSFDRTLPELTVTKLIGIVGKPGATSYRDKNGNYRITERDVLQLLIEILDEREQR